MKNFYYWASGLVILIAIGVGGMIHRAREPARIIASMESLGAYDVLKIEKLADRLVILVGGEKAIEMVEAASIPKGGISHLIAHEIGAAMYLHYGKQAIVECQDDGLNGCLHGFIIASVSQVGFSGVFDLIKECKNYSDQAYKMCVHGAGHAFLAMVSYEIKDGVQLCDELVIALEDSEYDTKRWCGTGLFMENVHGDHNGLIPPLHPSLSPTDKMTPCETVLEEYRGACFNNQAGWWHQLNGGDIAQTLTICQDVPNEYRHECVDNVARILNTMFPNQVEVIAKYCDRLGVPWSSNCLESAAISSIFVGNYTPSSLLLCGLSLIPKDCVDKLYDEAKWQAKTGDEIKSWCNSLSEINKYDCSIF